MVDERSANRRSGQIKDPHVRQVFEQRLGGDLKDPGQHARIWLGSGDSASITSRPTSRRRRTPTLERSRANPDAERRSRTNSPRSPTRFHAATGLSDQQRHDIIKEQQRAVVLGYANAAIEKDPTFVVGDAKAGKPGLLQSSDFNKYLEPGDIETLRNSGGVEIRRQEAEARAAQARAEAKGREFVSVLKNQASSGVELTDEQLAQGTAIAKQFGLTGDEWDLGVIRDKRDVSRQYKGATPVTIHHDLNELQAKVAAGKASPAEQVHLKNLEAFAGPAIAQFNSDPYAAAAAGGDPAPELGDLNHPDPARVQARISWARAFAASSGLVNVPYLSNDEAKIFTDGIRQGPAGQIAASATLRAAFGGTIATAIVKQLAPGNKDLELMVGLHPRVAELYKRGVAALEGKTVQLGSSDQTEGQADKQALADTFGAYAEAIPVDMQPALRRAAENITAGVSAEWGQHAPSGEQLTGAFAQSMQRAGGMLGSPSQNSATGGFAKWEGHYVWLPQTMSRSDFQTRMSRAGKADWIKAAGGAPHYLGTNGKVTPLSDRQIEQLPHYRLETVNPGVYRLVGPDGGHVVMKDGRTPFQFDIRQLR
jgi:hypothetical protein